MACQQNIGNGGNGVPLKSAINFLAALAQYRLVTHGQTHGQIPDDSNSPLTVSCGQTGLHCLHRQPMINRFPVQYFFPKDFPQLFHELSKKDDDFSRLSTMRENCGSIQCYIATFITPQWHTVRDQLLFHLTDYTYWLESHLLIKHVKNTFRHSRSPPP